VSTVPRSFVSFSRFVFGTAYCLVSVSLGFTLVTGILVTVTAYRSNFFREGFIREIESGNGESAVTLAGHFKRPVPFENLLYLPKELRNATTKSDVDSLVDDLLVAFQLVLKDKFGRASEQFFGRVDGNLRILLETLPKVESRNVSLEALRQQFLTLSNAEAQMLGPLAKAEQQRERGLERYKQQAILLEDIVLETSELFGMKPVKFETTDIESDRFYKDGVLAGLPRLEGLADAVTTVEELSTKLNSLGGKVSLHGTNVPEQFNNRLSDLKSSAQVFSGTMEQLAISLKSSNSALKETQRILDKNKILAKTNLVLLLRDLSGVPSAAEKNPYFLLLEKLATQIAL
jgi:hypothetical protein